MDIKAAVFDIDGTLVPHGMRRPSPETESALRALSQSGVRVIIATGRARYAAEAVLGDVHPDYFAAVNGADVTDAAGHAVSQNRMTQEEMYALVDFCEDYELPLQFIFSDAYYAYVEAEYFDRRLKTHGDWIRMMRDGEDQVRHLQDMPFGACAAMDPQHAQMFAERYGYLGLRFIPFAQGQYDVLRVGSGKVEGVARLLNRLGLTWEQTAAFGDGENDAEMLAAAGFAVAMENGAPKLRALADVVAPPADEDGVARVVRQSLLRGREDGNVV